MRRILASSSVLFIAFAVLGITSAKAAVPLCTGMKPQRTLFSDQGRLESVIVGGGGSIFVSGTDLDGGNSAIFSYTYNGPKQDRITTAGDGPGGLAWSGRRLLWGYGNNVLNGTTGDLDPKAGLYSVNPANGNKSIVSDHLGMANGVARAKDGTIYASNDFGLKLDRITREGTTYSTGNGWASLKSGNGMVIGKNGRFLLVNQTFVTPSTIAMIDTRNPSRIFTYYTAPEAANVIFDGLARDSENNLYVAVFGRGEVWKITPDRQACVLATGIAQPSSVTISNAKKGYRAGNLYAVGFGGEIVQVRSATSARVPG